MKKDVKKRFQEMLLDAVKKLPMYPSIYQSDTTWIANYLCRTHPRELIKMGIIDHVDDSYWKRHKFLRQLNNLHKEGRLAKKIEYGGEGQGRNWTFVRWGPHARM